MAAKDYLAEAVQVVESLNAQGISASDSDSIAVAKRRIKDTILQLRDVKRQCNDEQRTVSARNSARGSVLGGKRKGVLGAINQASRASGRAQVEQYRQAKSQIDGLISQLQAKQSELRELQTALKPRGPQPSRTPPPPPPSASTPAASAEATERYADHVERTIAQMHAAVQGVALRLRPLQLAMTDQSDVKVNGGDVVYQSFVYHMERFAEVRAFVAVFASATGNTEQAVALASQVVDRSKLKEAGGFVYGTVPAKINGPAALVPVWSDTVIAADAEIDALLSAAVLKR